MGLDMYLKRGRIDKVKAWNALSIEEKDEREDDYPYEEVGYWRKANQIRQWFVENCGYPENGDCEYVEVTKDKLEQLKSDCKKVLENHELAHDVMPTSVGFFFGSTAYDECYYSDLENTISIVNDVLEFTNFDEEVVCYTDWW